MVRANAVCHEPQAIRDGPFYFEGGGGGGLGNYQKKKIPAQQKYRESPQPKGRKKNSYQDKIAQHHPQKLTGPSLSMTGD